MKLDRVLAARERLPEIGAAASNTGASTVGWIPGIERMAREGPRVRLALSVHAPEDALRLELMPVNERYPLRDVLAACMRWHERRRRQLFVEHLMLDGVNDRYEQAGAGAAASPAHRLQGQPDPLQPDRRGLLRLGARRDRGVPRRAGERGLRTTVRLTRGRDIDAACGQLAART